MELYDKKYVYFEWDDKLEGKEVILAHTIKDIKEFVGSGNKGRFFIAQKGNDLPFTNGLCECEFAYYDPNYEIKKAYNEGKKLQWKYRAEEDWNDWDKNSCPTFSDDTTGYELRVKPDDIDYDTGVINNEVLSEPLVEEPEKSDKYKDFFIETERIIQSEHTVEDKLITILYNIETMIRSIRGCSNINVYNFVRTICESIKSNIVEPVKTCRCKEPEKDRYLTNKELAVWLATGYGQVMNKGTGNKSASYDYYEDDKGVDFMSIVVRKWEDEEWHEPTYNYCFGDK